MDVDTHLQSSEELMKIVYYLQHQPPNDPYSLSIAENNQQNYPMQQQLLDSQAINQIKIENVYGMQSQQQAAGNYGYQNQAHPMYFQNAMYQPQSPLAPTGHMQNLQGGPLPLQNQPHHQPINGMGVINTGIPNSPHLGSLGPLTSPGTIHQIQQSIAHQANLHQMHSIPLPGSPSQLKISQNMPVNQNAPHQEPGLPSPNPESPNNGDNQFLQPNFTPTLSDFNSLNPPTLLKTIYQLQRAQKEELSKIRQIQKGVMVAPQKSSFEMLDAHHRKLKEAIENQIKALQSLYTQVILLPPEIHKVLLLIQELKIQQTQLELYHQELHQLASNTGPPRCIATLVIAQEPFPIVITKGKQLDDDPVVVHLLSGANVEFQSFGPMKVAMVWDNHQSKGNNQKNIDCDTQTMDAFNRVAKWHLRFLNGTRKNSVTLRFGMQVQVVQPAGPVTVTVESYATQPFIVITNECQWEESEGTLLKKDAFGEQNEIPWPQFANVLQRHFLRATRQDAISPTRSLCSTDFEYIHSKFFGAHAMISPKSYNSFWNWFGKTIKKLRYQRHILPLWQLGMIHGFLSREAVHSVLKDQDPGTFLVRFSERHPGQFAVAYRIDGPISGDCVRHYLVQPDDTAGNKKTLPDFLSEQTPFCYLLQIGTENENGVKVYHKFKKENILETYISKRNSLPPAYGYDSNIVAYQSPPEIEKELIEAE